MVQSLKKKFDRDARIFRKNVSLIGEGVGRGTGCTGQTKTDSTIRGHKRK